MTIQEITLICTLIAFAIAVVFFYAITKNAWYVRFDKDGKGHYNEEPTFIWAHTFEGAKRKAKRAVKKNNWNSFKLRRY